MLFPAWLWWPLDPKFKLEGVRAREMLGLFIGARQYSQASADGLCFGYGLRVTEEDFLAIVLR